MEILKRVFEGDIKEISEGERTITAYISTKARDRMDESLLPEGADIKRFNKNPVVLWAHDYSTPPIAKAIWTKKDEKGLVSKMKFADTEFAKEIFGLYKGGFMNAFSVGFLPKETEEGDGDKQPKRTYKKWELLEYSAVPVPANPEALSLAMQKGILHSEGLKKMFYEPTFFTEPHIIDIKSTDPNEEPQEEDDDFKGAVEGSCDKVATCELIKTLTEDNKKLQEQLTLAGKDISRLKTELYKAYMSMSKKIKAPVAEITVDELKGRIAEVVNGVISRYTGKVS